MVIDMVVAVFAATELTANDFTTCGLAICKVATAGAVFDPPLVPNAPAGMMLP